MRSNENDSSLEITTNKPNTKEFKVFYYIIFQLLRHSLHAYRQG